MAEADLWCAVVRRALRDAQAGDNRARDWLRRGGGDFATVCSCAGLDPEAVASRARRLWPEAVSPGPALPAVDSAALRALAALRSLAA